MDLSSDDMQTLQPAALQLITALQLVYLRLCYKGWCYML